MFGFLDVSASFKDMGQKKRGETQHCALSNKSRRVRQNHPIARGESDMVAPSAHKPDHHGVRVQTIDRIVAEIHLSANGYPESVIDLFTTERGLHAASLRAVTERDSAKFAKIHGLREHVEQSLRTSKGKIVRVLLATQPWDPVPRLDATFGSWDEFKASGMDIVCTGKASPQIEHATRPSHAPTA